MKSCNTKTRRGTTASSKESKLQTVYTKLWWWPLEASHHRIWNRKSAFLRKKRFCQYLVTLLFRLLRHILAGLVPWFQRYLPSEKDKGARGESHSVLPHRWVSAPFDTAHCYAVQLKKAAASIDTEDTGADAAAYVQPELLWTTKTTRTLPAHV